MLGYILIGIGSYLLLEDIFKVRKSDENLSKNGSNRNIGHRGVQSRTDSKTTHGGGKLKPKPVPIEVKNDVPKEPVQQEKPDPVRSSDGDDSSSQPLPAPVNNQSESIEVNENVLQNDSENVAGDNGDYVEPESIVRDESDGSENN